MPLRFPDLAGKVAIITGSSRGIGRECALALARARCNVVIAAKSTTEKESIPGTIHSVAKECEALGVRALPVQLDLRHAESIEQCVKRVAAELGRVDILINNASALWWQDIVDTPLAKYDLITSINTRGAFYITQLCLPHMVAGGFGRVICMSPPIHFGAFAAKTAYNISKFGMTMVALGVAEEYAGRNITGNSLWPATIVESFASKNFHLGDKWMWRKAAILADAAVQICGEPGSFAGHQLIDDTYLRSKGATADDIAAYRYDPAREPPRVLDPADPAFKMAGAKRGNVRDTAKDRPKSKL